MGDRELLEKLAKVEALFRGAATKGEKAAAAAARNRLQDRLKDRFFDDDPEIEMKFTFPDVWSVRLFVALCRKHGVEPYRYRRQRRTTMMARAPRWKLDDIIWQEFTILHDELAAYFQDVTDNLIRSAMHSDGDDSTLTQQQLQE